jgi:hypothetical protein
MDWSVPEKLKKGVSYARFPVIIYELDGLVKAPKVGRQMGLNNQVG